jgi:hypothetical protein
VHENLCAEELSLHGTHLVRVRGTEVGGVTSTCDAYMEKYKKNIGDGYLVGATVRCVR